MSDILKLIIRTFKSSFSCWILVWKCVMKCNVINYVYEKLHIFVKNIFFRAGVFMFISDLIQFNEQ